MVEAQRLLKNIWRWGVYPMSTFREGLPSLTWWGSFSTTCRSFKFPTGVCVCTGPSVQCQMSWVEPNCFKPSNSMKKGWEPGWLRLHASICLFWSTVGWFSKIIDIVGGFQLCLFSSRKRVNDWDWLRFSRQVDATKYISKTMQEKLPDLSQKACVFSPKEDPSP